MINKNLIKNKKMLLILGLSTSITLCSVSSYAKSTDTIKNEQKIQQESKKPIVELSKEEIKFHKDMINGKIVLNVYGVESKYNLSIQITLNKHNNANWYEYKIEDLKKRYNEAMTKAYPKESNFLSKFKGKFFISYTEDGKKTTRSRDFFIKEKYDKLNVEFIQRKNKEDFAKFKISFPDNKNFEKTAITNQFSKLKITKGSETEVLEIKKENSKIQIKNGYLEYKIDKNTKDETEFSFSQTGANFNDSDITKINYKVDKKETDEILNKIDNMQDETKQVHKITFDKYKEAINKKDITQKELDDINLGLGLLVKPALNDEIPVSRKKAVDTIKTLTNLSEKKQREYIAKISIFNKKVDLEKINLILEQAKKENQDIKDNKQKEQEKLEKEKQKQKEEIERQEKEKQRQKEEQEKLEREKQRQKEESERQEREKQKQKEQEKEKQRQKEEQEKLEREKQRQKEETERQEREKQRQKEEQEKLEKEKQKQKEEQEKEKQKQKEEQERQEREKQKQKEEQEKQEKEKQRQKEEQEKLEREKQRKKEEQEKLEREKQRKKEEQERQEREKQRQKEEQERLENTENKNIKLLNGKNQVFNKSKQRRISFRLSTDISEFKGVYLDEKLVSSSNYTLKRGSTIITFNENFSKSLKDGSHEFKFKFKEGFAKTTVIVKNNNNDNSNNSNNNNNNNNNNNKENETRNKNKMPKTNIKSSSLLLGLVSTVLIMFSYFKRKIK